jgi:serine/threonine-protein kinase
MLLKILDFGISKTPVGYEDLTGTQTVIGTPSYMAPEQMKSGRAADPRSDIWSIGVVIYQLINGHPPFSGESYAELVLKVGLEPPMPIQVPLPTGLGEIIMRCLEKDPALRHQNVGDLARVLAPYATDPVLASQSAGRAMRILQQRSLQGMQGSPLGAGGGLAAPIPISPAQLTPRSWPPSQGSSLSQSAGQMTSRTRGSRAWLIGGVAGLCVLAGGGGYAISQMSKTDRRADEPHVMAPLSRPTTDPPPPPDPAAPSSTTKPTPAAPVPTTPAAATAPAAGTTPAAAATAPTTDTKPADGKPATDTKPAAAAGTPDSQSWRPSAPAPTFPDHAKPGETKAGETKATETKSGTRTKPTDADKPANAHLVDAKQPGAKSSDTKAAKSGDKTGGDKTGDAKSSDAKSSDAKTGTKSTSKPKSKPSDDLFDSRH